MAKEVFSAKEWFADVAKGVELTEAQQEVVDGLLAQDAIQKNIGNSVLRQSDYSRQSDDLKSQRAEVDTALAEAETARQEATDFVTTQKDRDHNNVDLHDQLVTDLAEANRRLTTEGAEVVAPRSTQKETEVKEDEPKYMTEEQYEAREATRDQNAINYSNRVVQLSNKFRNDFGKDFDPEPVVEHATKNGMTLDAAYQDLYSKDYETLKEAAVQERIDTAVREKEIELRSNNDLPEVTQGPQRVSGLDQPEEDKLKTEGQRASAAVQGLREIRSGKRDVTSHWND